MYSMIRKKKFFNYQMASNFNINIIRDNIQVIALNFEKKIEQI